MVAGASQGLSLHPSGCVQRSVGTISAMPNLPKPRFGRPARVRGQLTGPPEIDAETPNVEVIEAPGLRWIHIERPRPADQAWLEERFDFHALDYEDVFSRNQRPKVDEYDDYLFVVLHFPTFDKTVGRLNAAELDIFVGPDFLVTLPNQPLPPVEYLFERCRTREDVRDLRWLERASAERQRRRPSGPATS